MLLLSVDTIAHWILWFHVPTIEAHPSQSSPPVWPWSVARSPAAFCELVGDTGAAPGSMGSPALDSAHPAPSGPPEGRQGLERTGPWFWILASKPSSGCSSMGHLARCLLLSKTTIFFSIFKFPWSCSSRIQFLPLCLNPSHALAFSLWPYEGT